MTFEQLREINATLHTMDVKGKAYTPVNERIKAFRMLYPEGGIETRIEHLDGSRVIIKATVSDGAGRTLSTGHACEIDGANYINQTSHIENCETSAIGRALGALGIGIDTAVCSLEEIQRADRMHEAITKREAAALDRKLSENQKEWIYKKYRIKAVSELSRVQYSKIIKQLEERGAA